MRETRVRSVGQEDPLEKEMATHSSILAWKISWMEPGRLQSMGLQRVGHDWATSLHFQFFTRGMFCVSAHSDCISSILNRISLPFITIHCPVMLCDTPWGCLQSPTNSPEDISNPWWIYLGEELLGPWECVFIISPLLLFCKALLSVLISPSGKNESSCGHVFVNSWYCQHLSFC